MVRLTFISMLEFVAMNSTIDPHKPRMEKTCSCCGRAIRLLDDRQTLSLFLCMTTLQQRAFRCMNCGRVVCHNCRMNGSDCICRSNAWVAVPCLENSPTASHRRPQFRQDHRQEVP